MKITKELLEEAGACEDQRREFEEYFPEGMQPTVENLSKAIALDLDVFWARNLLSVQAAKDYDEQCKSEGTDTDFCCCPGCAPLDAGEIDQALAYLSAFLLEE